MATMELATFCSQLKLKGLPPEVVSKAKDVIQEYVGVDLFTGHHTPWGKTIAEFAISEGAGDATVIGYPQKAIACRAALANGTMALGFEYEDVHAPSMSHINCSVVGAALAVAEKTKASGADVVAGVITGYEVAARCNIALGDFLAGAKGMISRGLYFVQIFGVFGAAAAAGRVLGLDPDKMAMALGLAGEQAAGTTQSHTEGAWSRRWHGGKASENGVTAALLSQRGFIGPRKMLEGEHCIYRALALPFEERLLTDGLGQSYQIMEAWFKAYSCNAGCHGPVEALLSLKKEHNIQPDQVEQIIGIPGEDYPLLATKNITTIMLAQYSLPYCLALAMVKGGVTPAQLGTTLVPDPAIIAYAQEKVETKFDEEMVAKGWKNRTIPGAVIIKLKNGKEYSRECLFPKGHPKNPMSAEELHNKFDILSNGVLPASQQKGLYNALRGLDKTKDISEATALMRPAK